MFPINANRRHKGTPYATYILLFLNVVVFIWELTLPPSALQSTFYNASLVPCKVGAAPVTDTLLASLFSMFLHGGWLHLMGNMAFLVIFGIHVEEYFGTRLFTLFYFGAGLGSALLHTLFNWNVCIPVVGASGAIFGIMGAFLLLYPGTKIKMLTFFYRIPMGFTSVPAFLVLGYYFLVNLLDGVLALAGVGDALSGVAVWGHIGGFVAGLAFTFVATMFKPAPPVDPLAHLDD